MQMDKAGLRKSIIKKLKELPKSEKLQLENKLSEQLVASPIWKKTNSIGITISQGFEWNTRAIIERAWAEDKQVSVPKCEPKKKLLEFYRFRSYDELEVVYYNLLEPKPDAGKRMEKEKIGLLIVPGLLFDKQGFRIGFGGGYYDRYLAEFTNDTISITSSSQLVEQLPRDTYDIPVKHIITECGMEK